MSQPVYSVKKIEGKSGLKKFIKFPFTVFKGNDCWVPPLNMDEMTVFNEKKNPAFKHAESAYWMVYKDGEPAGRIAGIVLESEAKEEQLARFGWIDFIDDPKVVELLLNTVEDWAREKGLKGVQGPMGFTDMDFEGLLVEGFDKPGTIATIYNHAYYPKHLEQYGYEKSIDWLQLITEVPDEVPKRLARRAEIIENRFNFKSLKFKSKKEAQKYGNELFEVLNQSYADLYGFHPLTSDQIQFYIEQYLGFVVTDFLSMVVSEEGKLVGFAITMPSLSKAFQKARGQILPFGAFHILRAMKKNDRVDMYLIGVLPEYQKHGVTAIIFRDLIQAYIDKGIKTTITNQMLESNQKVLAQFNEFNSEVYQRRRCYKKVFA